mmetsp:Transcript_40525/g.53344  ORF Transcript_40525/g.53344 Transcript_40525/m.53344 type:complete len:420 (+) Transcript_40525:151-1410(+)
MHNHLYVIFDFPNEIHWLKVQGNEDVTLQVLLGQLCQLFHRKTGKCITVEGLSISYFPDIGAISQTIQEVDEDYLIRGIYNSFREQGPVKPLDLGEYCSKAIAGSSNVLFVTPEKRFVKALQALGEVGTLLSDFQIEATKALQKCKQAMRGFDTESHYIDLFLKGIQNRTTLQSIQQTKSVFESTLASLYGHIMGPDVTEEGDKEILRESYNEAPQQLLGSSQAKSPAVSNKVKTPHPGPAQSPKAKDTAKASDEKILNPRIVPDTKIQDFNDVWSHSVFKDRLLSSFSKELQRSSARFHAKIVKVMEDHVNQLYDEFERKRHSINLIQDKTVRSGSIEKRLFPQPKICSKRPREEKANQVSKLQKGGGLYCRPGIKNVNFHDKKKYIDQQYCFSTESDVLQWMCHHFRKDIWKKKIMP